MYRSNRTIRKIIMAIIVVATMPGLLMAADDWTYHDLSTKPSARYHSDLAFIGNGKALLFGGHTGGSYDDGTWIYDTALNSWSQKTPSATSPPSGRFRHALAYIGDDKVLLFAGHDGAYDDSTYVYDLSANTWTSQSPVSSPSSRINHSLAHIGGDQVLLFGGTDGSYDDETWVYDLSDDSWTKQSPASSPSARQDQAMAYIGGDQVLLFGGYDGSNDDETWVYDLSDDSWTQKSPSSKPSARSYHTMAYLGNDQVLIFGGHDGSYDNETWVYDLSEDDWTQDANSSQPVARMDHAMCETSMDGSSFLLLFGGSNGPIHGDTWTFGGGDYSLPVVLSAFSAKSENGSIHLEWTTESETENLGFILERKSLNSEWIEIASYLTHDKLVGQGSVLLQSKYSFTDDNVIEGEFYDYRLADISYDGTKAYYLLIVVGIQAECILPTRYNLTQNHPNPFNPTTSISYDLPEPSEVNLTIYDVTGREVKALQNQERPAGHYEVQWNGVDESGNQVGTGVYFARLEASDYSKTIKMVYMK